jgi:ABC-type dipeptide/oligopeptide/nickel transport system ATPase component
MVPALIGRMHACHFAARCAHAIDACRANPVALTHHIAEGRAVRCVRAADPLVRGARARVS